MRSQIVRKRILAGTAIVLVVGSLVWYRNRGPNLDARTREYAESLHQGDWGHIYDMTPRKILQLQPWTRDQFITMMRNLDRGAFETGGAVQIKPIAGTLTSMQTFTFTAGSGTGGRAQKRPSMNTAFLRDFDDWRPDIFYVPLQLSLSLYPDQHSRAAALFDACRAAKITRIVRITGPLSLEVNRIPDFLDGKIEWAKLFYTGPDLLVSSGSYSR